MTKDDAMILLRDTHDWDLYSAEQLISKLIQSNRLETITEEALLNLSAEIQNQ